MISMALLSTTAQSQVTNNAESGLRTTESTNCWGFGAVTYTNTAAQLVTGNWSMRSNSPTSLAPGACWVKSPWLKPGSGNISLKIKFDAGSYGTTVRRVIASYISYDAAQAYGEGSFVRFDSTSYGTPLPTTNQDLSFPVPAAIASSGLPYKIQLSFVGTGGTWRYNIDDISIPGTYFSNPANNCTPIVEKPDTDKDGVLDTDDAYPNDASRAYNTIVPGNSQGTLMFEDSWPKTGDFDFNDLVLSYRYTVVTNASNKVVELKGTTEIRAIGAGYKNGFGIQLDNLSPSMITSVSGVKTNAPSWLNLNANGTEAGQTYANIIVIDNASRLIPSIDGSGFVNTVQNNTYNIYTPTEVINIVISFAENQVSIDQLAFNPYLIINQNRANEVHLADKAPTSKADTQQFGTQDDDSNIGSNRFYKNKNNLPWALDVPALIPYPLENKSITSGFLMLSKWAASSGIEYTDWYLVDSPAYRDNSIFWKR